MNGIPLAEFILSGVAVSKDLATMSARIAHAASVSPRSETKGTVPPARGL